MTDTPGAAVIDAVGGWRTVLGTLVDGVDLQRDVAAAALRSVLAGEASPAQIAGFVVALRTKGEAADEVLGMVDAMLEAATPVRVPADAIDIVGTGGAKRRQASALNVSTMACFVAAGAGAVVCKHGNRRASSTSGSFDVLEALGLGVELDAAGVERCLAEAGIAFCFARSFHPAMRHAAPVRAELGIPTIFNVLGPLSHPGGVLRQVIGVADPGRAELVLDVLRARGAPRAMVVHGHGELDELSTSGRSLVLELRDGEVQHLEVDPTALGLTPTALDDLPGGDPAENARLAEALLSGQIGPVRDIVLLNAAAGLVVAGIVDDLADGVARAAASIDEGDAAAVLDRLRAVAPAT
jgi:anthranilate phosphoribosyltransferase